MGVNNFHNYSADNDVCHSHKALIELFEVLDTPIEERIRILFRPWQRFLMWMGGLFANEKMEIPQLFAPESMIFVDFRRFEVSVVIKFLY